MTSTPSLTFAWQLIFDSPVLQSFAIFLLIRFISKFSDLSYNLTHYIALFYQIYYNCDVLKGFGANLRIMWT